jgi:excinuclease ABC subunit B
VLTKRLAEELTQYLLEVGVSAKYLHSDIDTLERVQILRDLRKGEFNVLVGINLLREGLDLPEVSLVAILDADKEGFLRSATALIQTCGRAARNIRGRVVMYADKQTAAITQTQTITQNRRALQEEYNRVHQITPQTTTKGLGPEMLENYVTEAEKSDPTLIAAEADHHYLTPDEIRKRIKECDAEMKRAAKEWRFEDAARFRDQLRKYRQMEIALS